jgi:dTDP-4-amino-4,6-dideoxygalactose transaminase
MDIYHQGKPTRMANLPDGLTVEQIQKPLKVANEINTRILQLPAFKKYDKDHIERTAAAFKKVVEHHGDLLKGIEAVVEEGGYGSSSMVAKS